MRRLADERTALQRVAKLVASGGPPDEMFGAVADELAGLTGAESALVARVDQLSWEHDKPWGSVTVVASHGAVDELVPIGFHVTLEPGMAMTVALRTGGPVRLSGDRLAIGPFRAIVGRLGMRAVVATPIVAQGRDWGVAVAATSRRDFPADTESRMADFMEPAAMAVANAQAQQELRELAETQASVRRLAMLVARGEPPEVVFTAVAKEARRHFGSGTARLIRYELDGTVTLLADEGTARSPADRRRTLVGLPAAGLAATVLRTGRVARVDDYRDLPGGEPYLGEGPRSAVAMPIYVHGRLWGTVAVGSEGGPLPPAAEERMTEFTDLMATAVANAQSLAELTASRARIVAAADDARRRIEHDLHDGAQQRLVTLALRLHSAAATSAEPGDTSTEITAVAAELLGVIDDLREISRGIHPAILSEAGLRPALRALGRRSAVPVEIDVRVDGRLPEPVEVGAYYVVSEMLANAAKHARASLVQVDAEASGGVLRVRVRDDGIGGADPVRGPGLVGLKDRIEALGGTFSVHSPAGRGTSVSCELPVNAGGPHLGRDPAG
jgi:signal transduction histidine kinase